MDAPRFLSGQFLLAMPGIGDPRFEKAVIAMCVHDEEGALGIGLGRVVPRLGFHDLLKQLEIAPGEAPNVPIHHGGPVEPQRGFILHTPDWGGSESVQVGDRWVLSATLDILKAIAEGKGPTPLGRGARLCRLGPGPARGASWRRHGWFATPGDESLLYDCDVDIALGRRLPGGGDRLPPAHRGVRDGLRVCPDPLRVYTDLSAFNLTKNSRFNRNKNGSETSRMRASDSAARACARGRVGRTIMLGSTRKGGVLAAAAVDAVRERAGPGGDGVLEPDPGRRGQGPGPAIAADGGDLALPAMGVDVLARL